MRKMIAIGTAAVFASLALSGAARASNPNVPSYSPYQIMGYDDSTGATSGGGNPGYGAPAMSEGRAAYVDPGSASLPNTNVYPWSPYSIMPQGQ